jgi:predicted CXXCH cytochrome family protein
VNAPRRIACRAVAALALALAPGVRELRASGLGPHGDLSTDSGGCTACHVSPTSRGLDIGGPKFIDVPAGGKARLADLGARICWVCHRAGNPYGARPIDGRALNSPGHGVIPGKATTADSWAIGQPLVDPFMQGRVWRTGMGRIRCGTCHDAHDGASPLFLRRGAPAEADAGPCAACHPGRENAGLTGRRNIVVRDSFPYSTHPAVRAGAAPAAAGAIPRCVDCHDVHRAPPHGERPIPGLLRGAPGETASDLCRRCHAFPAPGSRESHPMEAAAAGRLPAGSFASPGGLPDEWRERQHLDRGAAEIRTGEAPRCTSCHDLHGGLPMTSLLYAPDAGSRRGGDWCFSCHPRDALLKLGHAGAAPDPGGGCARCHGPRREGSPPRWEAHRGFRAVSPAAPLVGGAAGPGSTVPALDELAVSGLVEALRDRQPAARDQAFEVLTRLQPKIDPAVLRPAAGDARPEVRMRAARVIGAIGDRRGGDILLPLAADADAQVRAAAALALAHVGEPRAAAALLPLLADPANEPRHAAVAAFAKLRDPLAIPGLVGLLDDRDFELSHEAREVLASLGDARALAALLPEGRPPAAAAHLNAVLEKLSDPAALENIIPLVGHRNRLVRATAASVLGRYARPGVAEALAGALLDKDVAVSTAAAESLVRIGDPRAESLLAGVLLSPDAHPQAKSAMATSLSDIATPSVLAPLVAALADADAGVREAANNALARLTCRNFGADQARWREWWDAQPPDFPLGGCR